jgi:hypothetical protein
MYTKQPLTKSFLIAIALFVLWGGTAEAKDSSPKQAGVFGWKSSPLLAASTVDIWEQQRWLGVSAVQDSHSGESLKKAGSSNPNNPEAYSASGSAYFFVSKDRKDSGEAFEGAGYGCVWPRNKFLSGSLAGFLGYIGGDIIGVKIANTNAAGVLGGMGGNIIGSSLGVYLYGRSIGETGSYWTTLIGTALGTSGGVLAALASIPFLGEDAFLVFFISEFILPAAGATIGFNMTKGKEQKDSSAINLEEGNISFAFPSLQMQVSQIPNHRPETDYTLRLVSVSF